MPVLLGSKITESATTLDKFPLNFIKSNATGTKKNAVDVENGFKPRHFIRITHSKLKYIVFCFYD